MYESFRQNPLSSKAGQNGVLSLSAKLSNILPLFWNYLEIYPCFKLDSRKIEFQWKTWFNENRVISKKLAKTYMELKFHVSFCK